MEIFIREGQKLLEIERNIEKEVSKCEFWGDLELSVEELDILKERLRAVFNMRGNSVYSLCKV